MAETVRRAVRQAFEKATGVESETSNPSEWVLQGLTPYRAVKNWQTLGLYAIQNVIAGTIALYVAHRFMPSSFVTSTNSFLHKFIPIQLTPDYIPLTRYIGF
ncbi:MAG TPA: hypothetical protein VFU89_01880 [Rhabdochlamydiaceae bacterium]|nr:hypothetical protein [Rhabdochlamydiaceae bacterium]